MNMDSASAMGMFSSAGTGNLPAISADLWRTGVVFIQLYSNDSHGRAQILPGHLIASQPAIM